MAYHFLLQEIFPTQGLNPGLPHCRQRFYRLRHQGSPIILKGISIPNKIRSLYDQFSSDQFSSVQSLSGVRLFATLWIAPRQTSLSITNSRSSLKLTSIELVILSSHLIICRPLLLLLPIPPSIRVFQMSQLFTGGGQSTGVSALASFLPKKSQGWSPLEWTRWISLQSKRLSGLGGTNKQFYVQGVYINNLWKSAIASS